MVGPPHVALEEYVLLLEHVEEKERCVLEALLSRHRCFSPRLHVGALARLDASVQTEEGLFSRAELIVQVFELLIIIRICELDNLVAVATEPHLIVDGALDVTRVFPEDAEHLCLAILLVVGRHDAEPTHLMCTIDL